MCDRINNQWYCRYC